MSAKKDERTIRNEGLFLLRRMHCLIERESRELNCETTTVWQVEVKYSKGQVIMDAKKQRLITVLLVGGFVFVALTMVNGCKKEESAGAPTGTSSEHDHEHGEQGHTHDSEMAMATESAKEVASSAEQTTCPIMEGNPIDKAVTEYKGTKGYFCCSGCTEKFEQEPEKYIAKLPQFSQ